VEKDFTAGTDMVEFSDLARSSLRKIAGRKALKMSRGL
jgi:hypothetical protein